jgi:hypothetical protein
MPPKHRQLRAPSPKPAGNAYQTLVDLPEDGSNSTFDGRDAKVDGTDNNSVVNASKRVSAVAASGQSTSCDDDDSTFAQETKDILWVFQQTATIALFINLVIYSLSVCNLKVMALV